MNIIIIKSPQKEKSKTIDFISNINKSININTIEEFIYDLDSLQKNYKKLELNMHNNILKLIKKFY